MPTTDQQRRAIAFLCKTKRDGVTGATKFEEPGIMAALTKVRGMDVADTTIAAMHLAADPSIKTPAMLGDTSSSVWRERASRALARRHPTPATACRTCGKDVNGCGCDNPTTRPEPRDPAWQTAQAAAARALLHPTERQDA